jgi:hypothetical protein
MPWWRHLLFLLLSFIFNDALEYMFVQDLSLQLYDSALVFWELEFQELEDLLAFLCSSV